MSPVINSRPGFNNFPPVIKFLMIGNVAIFLLTMFIGEMTGMGAPAFQEIVTQNGGLRPWETGDFMPWQLITYQFLHADFLHLIFNMFGLWMFGVELENLWGSRKFGTFYILAGIAAAISHLIVVPLLGLPLRTTIGASGSIMGVLVGFALTFPTRPVMIFPLFFPIPARIFVLLYAAYDLFNGVTHSASGVAHFAHLGGALGGFLLIKFGEPLFRWVNRMGGGAQGIGAGGFTRDPSESGSFMDDASRNAQRGRAVETQYERQEPVALHRIPAKQTPTRFVVDGEPITQETIDEILDKISQFGPHSISAKEKRILYEVSKQM